MNFPSKYASAVFWSCLVLLSLAGGYLVYYTTAIGPWAFSDSTVYIASGVNWIHGGGMGYTQSDGAFARLLHYPPGYPVLIGLTSLISASPVDAARWINIVSFSLLIFLGGWLIWRITSSRLFAILYGVLILFSPFLLMPFSGIMSESSAILAGTLALLMLGLYAKTGQKIHLVLAGLLAAGALFLRYQQVSVLLSGGIFLLLISKKPWLARLKQTLIYAFVSAVPFAIWLLIATLANGGSARLIGLQGDPGTITLEFLQKIFSTVKYWFPYRSGLAPFFDASIIRVILVVVFLALLTFGWLKSRRAPAPTVENSAPKSFVLLCVVYLVVYLLFLLAASIFANPPPYINNRMLSPMLPILFSVILGLEYLATWTLKKWFSAAVMLLTTAMFCLTFAPQVKDYSFSIHKYGDGYTSFSFINSPLIAQLPIISMDRPIITNSPSLILFYTSKDPYRTFEVLDDPAIASTIRYGDQDTRAQLAFREECGALVIIDPERAKTTDRQSPEFYPPEVYDVTNGLIEILEDPIGNIYLYPGCE